MGSNEGAQKEGFITYFLKKKNLFLKVNHEFG